MHALHILWQRSCRALHWLSLIGHPRGSRYLAGGAHFQALASESAIECMAITWRWPASRLNQRIPYVKLNAALGPDCAAALLGGSMC
jgi:hypothetical protein